MHVAFLGLGLIGGSIARAVRAAGWTSAAWTPHGAGPSAALAEGVVDRAPSDLAGALAGAGLVVLAASPTACLDLLETLAGTARDALAPGAVITDVASTKVRIVERAGSLGLRFVGGHPMAGRETSGFGASDAGLLRGRPWVVVPADHAGAGPDEAAIERVESLVRACGARPVRMAAGVHDAAVAGVSHLPLVVAAALVEAVAGGPGEPAQPGWEEAAALAATGWAGATRLARGDVAMAAGIAATNARPLAARVRALRERLDAWLELLESADPGGQADEAALRARFEAARARLVGDEVAE